MPFPDHNQTAQYLDDIRLNKQIVEAYQIAEICLIQLGLRQGKTAWKHHPIVKNVYNNGKPYLPDLYRYITTCDREWIRRGKNRGSEFRSKLLKLGEDIFNNINLFSWEPMKVYESYDYYKLLLKDKWDSDKIVVKCSIGGNSNVRCNQMGRR